MSTDIYSSLQNQQKPEHVPIWLKWDLYKGSDNSPLLILLSAYHIDQSIVTFMRLKLG